MTTEIKNPEAEATTKQTYLIFRLGGGDVRSQNLTRQQASDMIASLMANKGLSVQEKTKNLPKKTDEDFYEEVWVEAIAAAEQAGAEWMANARPKFRVVERGNPLDDNSPITKDYGTMLDVCGFAYIELRDKRNKFVKWLRSTGRASDFSVRIHTSWSPRQELGLAEATKGAALAVFRKHDLSSGLSFSSRID